MTDLPAGPELDCLVAERVMGWHDVGDGWWRESAKEHAPHAGVGGLSAATHGNCIYAECIFQPSEDIAHAWEVVDRMSKRWHVGLDSMPSGQWRCTIASLSVTDATAQLAICRAAIAATA